MFGKRIERQEVVCQMPNAFWYGVLIAASIIIIIFTLHKTKDKKVIALYTFISGLIYCFEYVVLILFNSYVYYPHLLKNAYFDSLVGAIVSNAFAVPMSAVFIAAVKPKWKWILFITLIFLMIESWFLKIEIYSHNWWRLLYTAMGLICCFLISVKWYSKLTAKITWVVRFITIYFSGILIQSSIVFILVALLDLYHYEIGWFENESQDHIAFVTAYIMFLSSILSSLATFELKWLWKIIILIPTLLFDYLLFWFGILNLSAGWSLWYFIFIRLFFLVLLVSINDNLLSPNRRT